VTDKYEFIESQKSEEQKYAYPVTFMCAHLSVSTSGFYEWRSRPESATAERREKVKLLVRKAFDDSDETYGYQRIHAQLVRWDVEAGPELVRSVMRELGLVACQPRPWRFSLTESGASGPIPGLVNRDFTADAPGVKMVGDITCIPTWEGWLYLATVIDCHTKAVVGWAMDDNTSSEFAETVRSLKIRQSVGRTGICYDNAMAESFFTALKNERVHRTEYPTLEHARRDIAYYIGSDTIPDVSIPVSGIRLHVRFISST
jgi:transposase InsO family protein